MKKITCALLAIGLAVLVPLFSFATETIGVVFNGSSEVNRETFMFLRKAVGQTGYSYEFNALSPSAALSGSYAGVIVLNTGRASGTDPVLADFISKNKAKAKIVLVNLFQNQASITATLIPAKSNDLGVDAIASASLWNKGGMGGGRGEKPSGPPASSAGQGAPGGGMGLNPQEAEHLVWFKAALKLIAEKKA